MFGKAGVWDGKPGVEVSCQDCRRTAHRKGDTNVESVLHRYDLTGWLFATEIVRSPNPDSSKSDTEASSPCEHKDVNSDG